MIFQAWSMVVPAVVVMSQGVVSQGDEVQVRVLNVRDGKLSLAMSPYVEKTAEEIEAEKSRPR